MSNTIYFLTTSTLALFITLTGCGSEDQSQKTANRDTTAAMTTDLDNSNAPTAGHGGAIIPLGNTTIGPFNVIATRDEGLIIEGKDAPIDVTVTASTGSTVTAMAVRFWIGTQDAVGSMKAKSEIENPAEPNRWHTHADVPDPIPAGSKLWVEIETDAGTKVTGSFDLKSQQN